MVLDCVQEEPGWIGVVQGVHEVAINAVDTTGEQKQPEALCAWSYLVTTIGRVMASSPGYSLNDFERGPEDKQIPTAPSEHIEPFWKSV